MKFKTFFNCNFFFLKSKPNKIIPIIFNRNNSLIKTLYREFQLGRNRIRETVKENIIEECKKPEQWDNLDEDNMEIDDDMNETYDEVRVP